MNFQTYFPLIVEFSFQFLAPVDDTNSRFDEIHSKFILKEYLPEPIKGRYLERSTADSKHTLDELTHAHSHDFTNQLVHVRKLPNVEEKLKIKEHYSHMNVKSKVRDPNTYAEIFQETSADVTGEVFSILVEFQPNSSVYGKKYMEFHEILHLDIHLGPSVPLHLHAKLLPSDHKPCNCVKKYNE